MEVPKVRHAYRRTFQIIAAIGISVFVIGTSIFSTFSYERNHLISVSRELQAIAELKVAELTVWRSERIGDGAIFSQNLRFTEALLLALESRPGEDGYSRLLTWMKQMRDSHGYESLMLYGSDSRRLLSFPEDTGEDPVIAGTVQEYLKKDAIEIMDFYVNPADGRVYLSVMVPIGTGRNKALLAMRIDPYDFLYSYIAKWPSQMLSGELVLTRLDGGEDVYLSPLRFATITPTEYRHKILPGESIGSESDKDAQKSVHESVDYRGTPTMAYRMPVGDSPWKLVVQVGKKEIDAETRGRRRLLLVLIIAVMGAASTGVISVSRRWHMDSISKEIEATSRIRESEERLRLALAAADQGLYDLNVQTGKAIVNEEYARMLGYDPAAFEETNDNWISRLHPDDHDAIAKAYADYISGKTPDYRIEFRQKTREGVWKWILSLGKIIEHDSEGKPLRMLGTHTDISTLKSTELALRASEERYRRTLDDMLEGCQILSFDWKYLYLNDTAVRYSHQPRENLLGHTMMECYPGIEKTRLFKVLEASMKLRESNVIEFEFTYPGGEVGWFEMSAQPTPEGLFILTMDITERKHHEIELRELNAALEQKVAVRTMSLQAANTELEAFAYSVAHDLRAPLRFIDGFARILEEDHSQQLDLEGKRILRVIRDSDRKMDTLINDLLEVTKIGKTNLVLTTVDMHSMAIEAFNQCADPMALSSFEMHVGSLPTVEADHSMMARVWQNLMSNAVKYSIPSPIHRIEVDISESNGMHIFSVRDFGVGFNPDYSGKLFGMFQRLHSEEEFPGSGIGLAIVKRIITRHGGAVWAEGGIGTGATIRFSLPKSGTRA
jgi:PAS domain S-box-containing protein